MRLVSGIRGFRGHVRCRPRQPPARAWHGERPVLGGAACWRAWGRAQLNWGQLRAARARLNADAVALPSAQLIFSLRVGNLPFCPSAGLHTSVCLIIHLLYYPWACALIHLRRRRLLLSALAIRHPVLQPVPLLASAHHSPHLGSTRSRPWYRAPAVAFASNFKNYSAVWRNILDNLVFRTNEWLPGAVLQAQARVLENLEAFILVHLPRGHPSH